MEQVNEIKLHQRLTKKEITKKERNKEMNQVHSIIKDE